MYISLYTVYWLVKNYGSYNTSIISTLDVRNLQSDKVMWASYSLQFRHMESGSFCSSREALIDISASRLLQKLPG